MNTLHNKKLLIIKNLSQKKNLNNNALNNKTPLIIQNALDNKKHINNEIARNNTKRPQ